MHCNLTLFFKFSRQESKPVPLNAKAVDFISATAGTLSCNFNKNTLIKNIQYCRSLKFRLIHYESYLDRVDKFRPD